MKIRQTVEHPSPGVLLLHLASELPEREARAVAGHLAGCWTCVARAERLKQGIQAFVEAREISNQAIIVPAPRTRALRERIEFIEGRRASVRLREWWDRFCARLLPLRSIGIVASIAVPVLVLFSLVTRPPKLSAADLLLRASRSVKAETTFSNRRIYRKIRIRSGAQSIDWESDGGAVLASSNAGAGNRLASMLKSPIRWEDPLSVTDFQHWRDAQQPVQDEIFQLQDVIVLTTLGHNPHGVLRSSLTVRRRDWHPISKIVEVDGRAPIEVTEIAWELHDPLPEKVVAHSARTTSSMPAPASSSELDREWTELKARNAFFSLGVGITGDEPGFEVRRAPDMVEVQVATSSVVRKLQLQQALASIAGLRLQITGSGDSSDSGAVAAVVPPSSLVAPSHPAEPLLWKFLVTKLGSAENASRYSNGVLEAAAKGRAIVAQLHQLSIRYPEESVSALTVPAQTELQSLQRKMTTSFAQANAEYDGLLEGMFESRDHVVSADQPASWQHRANALFQLISTRDRLIARLFAMTVPDNASPDNVDEAVQQLTTLNAQITAMAGPLQAIRNRRVPFEYR